MKKSRAEKSLEALLEKAVERETLAGAEVRVRELQVEEANTLATQAAIHRQEVQDALETAREIQNDTQPAEEQAGQYRAGEEALIDQVECLECGAIGTADERACFCSEHGEAYDTTQREET